jgi:hypothetical protein
MTPSLSKSPNIISTKYPFLVSGIVNSHRISVLDEESSIWYTVRGEAELLRAIKSGLPFLFRSKQFILGTKENSKGTVVATRNLKPKMKKNIFSPNVILFSLME